MAWAIVREIRERAQALKGGKLDVLVTIAEFADANGERACPSVTTLARLTHLSKRQIYRHLKALEAEGYLAVGPQPHPVYGTKCYTVLRPWLGGDVDVTCTNVPDDMGVTGGVTSASPDLKQDLDLSPDILEEDFFAVTGLDRDGFLHRELFGKNGSTP